MILVKSFPTKNLCYLVIFKLLNYFQKYANIKTSNKRRECEKNDRKKQKNKLPNNNKT